MPAVLDAPTENEVVDRFGFCVRGWVWLGDDQRGIAALEVWSGAILLGETETLTMRPDVCAALGLAGESRPGFSLIASYPTAVRGSAITLELRVRRRDDSRSDSLAVRTIRSLGGDEKSVAGAAPGSRGPADAPYFDSLPQPPEHLQIRQLGGVWHRYFYREGRVIMNQLAAAFAEAGMPLGGAAAILDFGCGCGRVLGNFVDIPHVGVVWGCDIDAEAIAWNQASLAGIGRFCANPCVPPTAFANGQFDAIYSVSVFTHLPEELQFAWLTELRRILRPGGVLIASVHGGGYWSKADAEVRTEVATRGFAYRTGPRTAGLPDFYMLAFHSESYIRTKWTRFFEFVALKEKYIHGEHDAVIMRRPLD